MRLQMAGNKDGLDKVHSIFFTFVIHYIQLQKFIIRYILQGHQPHTFLLAVATKFVNIARLYFGLTSAQNVAAYDTQNAIDVATMVKSCYLQLQNAQSI